MSVWYRVSQTECADVNFSGEGGLYVAGRWNYLGKKAVYCSSSIALCTLEWLAHNGLSVSGFNYYKYSITIPDALIRSCSSNELLRDWNKIPATEAPREFADVNLFSSSTILALKVPSVIIPEEFNLIINPLHPEFNHAMETIKQLGEFKASTR